MSLESRPGKRGSPEQRLGFYAVEHLRLTEYPRAVLNYSLFLVASGVPIKKAMGLAKELLEERASRRKMREFVETVEEALATLPITNNVLNQPTLPAKHITFLKNEPGKTPLARAMEWLDVLSSLFRIAPPDLVNEVLKQFPSLSNYEPDRWEDALKIFKKNPRLFGVLPTKPNTQSR